MIGRRIRRTLTVVLGAALVVATAASARPDRMLPAGKTQAAKTAQMVKGQQFLSYDVRVTDRKGLASLLPPGSLTSSASAVRGHAAEQGRNIRAGLAGLRTRVPTAQITASDLTAAVEVVGGARPLTAPSPAPAPEIVRTFITQNKDLYGLTDADIAGLSFSGESVNQVSGLRMVVVRQLVNGRAVFQSDTRFVLDRNGRIVKSLGLFVPNATSIAPGLENLISPREALRATMAKIGIALNLGDMSVVQSESGGLDTKIAVADPRITGTVTSQIVYFALAPGVLVPAWSQVIFGQDADWYALADASNGALLWRKNIRDDASTHPARFRVYVQADGTTPADSPAPQSPSAAAPGAGTQYPEIAPSIVAMLTAQDIVASPNGWIDDCPGGGCTANETQTLGNNVLACLDAVATLNVCDTALDGNGRPTGNTDSNLRDRDFLGTSPRDFETFYLPPPQGGAGMPENGQLPGNDSFRRGAITHMFYGANWYHDRLYTYGFTPAAGNFQQDNFGGGGAGNDRVLVDVQDGSGTNNANFATPPDGTSGRAQMYIFTSPTVDRDGGLDAEIYLHELTHGLSNRLIGNATGLPWHPGRGMGEGWSDFYALSLLNNTNADTPSGNYAAAAYATYKLSGSTDNYVYGIRRFPYSTNNSVNPLTWADVDDVTNDLSGGIPPTPLTFNANGALEVHNVGEIWANTLWEVRSRVIADPAGANGNVPTGNNTMLSIVTDALKLTPLNPSFVEGRNAIIDADCAANAACPNEQWIWEGFADRGLGYGAIAPLGRIWGIKAGHMGIGESFAVPNLDVNTVTVDDSGAGGNNTGNLDPNEPANLAINLKNPWRGASKDVASASATLTSSTPGVVIVNGSTSYGPIPATGNANATGPALRVQAPPAAACGSSVDFTLTITSSLGVVARNFTLRLGSPSGTGAPITYTRDPSPDIAIPDNAPRGVGDSLTISDDYEIADLNFKLDSLTHTFEGDVTVMLKGPTGYGTDVLSAVGAGSDTGPGDNFIDTVIDDTAAPPNDLLTVTSASAPMTGDWLTIFNTPSWSGFGFPVDPVGQLSRFNGSSTKGTWNLRVSDQFPVDTGTLNKWSLIVTPRAFSCSPPTAATVAVSGRVKNKAGAGVRKAVVTLVSTTGAKRRTVTTASGSYSFGNVLVGQTYVISAKAAPYRFASRVVTVNGRMRNVDFKAK